MTVLQSWEAHAQSETARRTTCILVGPWSYRIAPGGRVTFGPGGEFENVSFGAHAEGDNIGEHLRW